MGENGYSRFHGGSLDPSAQEFRPTYPPPAPPLPAPNSGYHHHHYPPFLPHQLFYQPYNPPPPPPPPPTVSLPPPPYHHSPYPTLLPYHPPPIITTLLINPNPNTTTTDFIIPSPNSPLPLPSLPPPSTTPTRALLLTSLPPDAASESSVRRDLELFGDVRAVQMDRVAEGIVAVHFYDIRAAQAALDEVRDQHMQHQTRLRAFYAAAGQYHHHHHHHHPLSSPMPPSPPAGTRGVVCGRAVWAQFMVPGVGAFPDGSNQGTVVVFNLDGQVDSDSLKQIFETFGPVRELRETPAKKHQRFIEFFDIRDAAKALAGMNGKEIYGREIVVEFSRPGGGHGKRLSSGYHYHPRNHSSPRIQGQGQGPANDIKILGSFSSSSSPPLSLSRRVSRRGGGLMSGSSPRNSQHHPAHHYHHHQQQQQVMCSYSRNKGPSIACRKNRSPQLPPPPPPADLCCDNGVSSKSCSPQSSSSASSCLEAQMGELAIDENAENLAVEEKPCGGRRTSSCTFSNGTPTAAANFSGAVVITKSREAKNCCGGISGSGTTSRPAWKGKNKYLLDPRFLIKEDAIVESSAEGEEEGCCRDTRTTVMIKNIPNKYSQKLLLNMLDNHCIHCNEQILSSSSSSPSTAAANTSGTPPSAPPLSSYDFLYLPIDFNNKCNVGYGFVNMTSPEATLRLYRAFHQQHWEVFNSRKICEVTYARVQGLEALKEHFKNSKFACDTDEYLPVVFSPPRDGRAHVTPPKPIVVTTSPFHVSSSPKSTSSSSSSSAAAATAATVTTTTTSAPSSLSDEEDDRNDAVVVVFNSEEAQTTAAATSFQDMLAVVGTSD